SGVSSFSDVNSDEYRVAANVSFDAIVQPKYTVTPELGIAYGQATVDSFGESNPADSLQALQVHGQSDPSVIIQGGVTGSYLVTTKFGVDASVAVSYDLEQTERNVSANVAGDPTTFTVQAPGMGDLEYTLGFGAYYNFTKMLSLHVNYDAGFSDKEKVSNDVSAGISLSF
ncbi:MAG TPA: autotransporter outer membrane beta-barrel domain-containing protein, partial [Opitutales bacterium]|nr:autotransporter outer membrane beta-barrel domain-containing protein [Opitutales bacterium]